MLAWSGGFYIEVFGNGLDISGLLGKEEKKDPSLWDDVQNQCSLTIKQRAIGFAICSSIGLLLSFLSFLFLASPSNFAILYTFGNICMISSTLFVVGPVRHIKNMLNPTRLICTIVFVLSMVFTLICVFKNLPVILIILSILIQFCALIYYCFSYIPYGRTCLRNLCSGVVAV